MSFMAPTLLNNMPGTENFPIEMPSSGGVLIYNDGVPVWQFVMKDGSFAYYDMLGNPYVP